MSFQPRFPEKDVTWRTRNGTDILISSMTDSHLMNTISMMERYARRQGKPVLHHAYSALCAEADNRHLHDMVPVDSDDVGLAPEQLVWVNKPSWLSDLRQKISEFTLK